MSHKNNWYPKVDFRCDAKLLHAFDAVRKRGKYKNLSRGDVIQIIMTEYVNRNGREKTFIKVISQTVQKAAKSASKKVPLSKRKKNKYRVKK